MRFERDNIHHGPGVFKYFGSLLPIRLNACRSYICTSHSCSHFCPLHNLYLTKSGHPIRYLLSFFTFPLHLHSIKTLFSVTSWFSSALCNIWNCPSPSLSRTLSVYFNSYLLLLVPSPVFKAVSPNFNSDVAFHRNGFQPDCGTAVP